MSKRKFLSGRTIGRKISEKLETISYFLETDYNSSNEYHLEDSRATDLSSKNSLSFCSVSQIEDGYSSESSLDNNIVYQDYNLSSETRNSFNDLNQPYNKSNSEDDLECRISEIDSLRLELTEWAVVNKVSHVALNGLLSILRKTKVFSSLPKDARTLLHTKPIISSDIKTVNPGIYYHFGIGNGIIQSSSRHPISSSEIKLVVGIDGLPISKSSSDQFWPILGYIRPTSNFVFLIGLYYGKEKPSSSNDFMREFVIEGKEILANGFKIGDKIHKVTIDAFCCDMPARAFILNLKFHNAYSSCMRCEIEGDYMENRMCFPYAESSKQAPKRTHSNYVERTDIDHHAVSSENSILIELPGIDVVSDFSFDYMHLVALGVVKKLLLLWIKGPCTIRLSSSKVTHLSDLIAGFHLQFPCEISRKPRGLHEVSHFKATEFRTFLLYIGPIILKNVISDDCYKNFMALNIAMIILLSPDYGQCIAYADDLLNYFVKTYEQIYGRYLMSSNIHGILHLITDYKKYGPLDQCSAFPFENFMSVLKSMLRKPHKPLQQIVMRYNEGGNFINKPTQNIEFLLGRHNKGPLLPNCVGPEFSVINFKGFKLKSKVEADSYFSTNNNEIVKLINIAYSVESGNIVLIGKKFECQTSIYLKPINSSYFGIFTVKNLSNNLNFWSIEDVKKKIILLSCNNNNIAIPLLHSIE